VENGRERREERIGRPLFKVKPPQSRRGAWAASHSRLVIGPYGLKAMVANLSIQRVSDPAETAAAITFLASPTASYITGAVLDSNGGYTA
jgi:NAD(P)-dependent dehydrogenase (short-subunit alcohol dehydrogenase family)